MKYEMDAVDALVEKLNSMYAKLADAQESLEEAMFCERTEAVKAFRVQEARLLVIIAQLEEKLS